MGEAKVRFEAEGFWDRILNAILLPPLSHSMSGG